MFRHTHVLCETISVWYLVQERENTASKRESKQLTVKGKMMPNDKEVASFDTNTEIYISYVWPLVLIRINTI